MKSDISGSRLPLFMARITAFILVLLPFHAFFTAWAANNFGHLDLFRIWKEIIMALMLPFMLIIAWRRDDTRKFLTRSLIVRLFLAYVLLHLAMGAWALHNHNVNKTALIYAFIVNLRFIAFFIFTFIIASHSKFLRRNIGKIIIIPVFIVIIVGLVQKLAMPHAVLTYFYGKGTIPPYQTIDGNNQIQRLQSTLRGANPLGAYLVFGLTAIAALVKKRFVWALSLALGLIVLFYSYSRSAWIGVFISFWLLAWWTLLKSHHRIWLTASAISILLTVGGGFYLLKSKPIAQDTLFHTSSLSKSPVSSNEARRTSLKNGVRDVLHEPLGRGPGTAGPASFRNKPHTTRVAENYYLQIGQEVGVIGMAIFIAINVLVAKQLWARRDSMLAHLLLASLAGITFINLISHAWADDTLSLLWWGLAGICLAPGILTGRLTSKNAKTEQKTA